MRAAVSSALLLAACNGGDPPRFVDPGPQVALVGQPLLLNLIASDGDGDSLRYDFSSTTLMGLDDAADLLVTPDGNALFSWTPLSADLGQHSIDFSVTDGVHSVHRVVPFDVRGIAGAGSAPVFRRPLGEGIVHDLGEAPCIASLAIEVHDPDDLEVTLTEQPPIIDGGELMTASDGLAGSWDWCPNAEQRATAGIFELTLAADDGDNPPTIKSFSIWLQRADEDCPTQRPVIEHTPVDVEQLEDPEIVAIARDDVGLLARPIVFWSHEPVEPDLMEWRYMEFVAGGLQQGTFRVRLPNPAVPLGVGEVAPLYYFISAGDLDSCFVRSPAEGVHEIHVTNPGGAGVGVCQPCSWDDQCGGAQDLCLPFGAEVSACGRACSGPADCGAGYSCSPGVLMSVQGASARQCIPDAGFCNVQACEDDDDEPNDTLQQALAQPAFGVGLLSGRWLCPDNEDWYRVELDASATILAQLTGLTEEVDLDLAVIDAMGGVPAVANGPSRSESLDSGCLPPGTYALRVYGSLEGAAQYDLSYVLAGC